MLFSQHGRLMTDKYVISLFSGEAQIGNLATLQPSS